MFQHSREELEILAKHIAEDENDYLKFLAAIHGVDLSKVGGMRHPKDLQSDLKRLKQLGMLEES